MSSTPFIGEIKIFAGNFQILGHVFCDGRLLSIAQNTALFALIGTTYGGDGQNTFGVPDLRGRIPIHMGNGAGLTPRTIGEMSGAETVTLLATQLPQHNHTMAANITASNTTNPAGGFWGPQPSLLQYAATAPNAVMKANALSSAGGNQPHNNMPPYLVLNYLLATEGIFPSRN